MIYFAFFFFKHKTIGKMIHLFTSINQYQTMTKESYLLVVQYIIVLPRVGDNLTLPNRQSPDEKNK